MNQPPHHQIATYLTNVFDKPRAEGKSRSVCTMPRRENVCCEETNYVLGELVKYVMEDSGCGIEQAMEKVYKSLLMEALQDEENELYVQSPAYLYELMNGQLQSI